LTDPASGHEVRLPPNPIERKITVMGTQNPMTPLLVVGGVFAAVYLLQTKKGTEQLAGLVATALVTASAQAIFSANQRRVC
jgi:hypothetical protein